MNSCVRRRQTIGYGLLTIFIAYSVFLILFYHVDIVSGRLVAHAHYQHIGLTEAQKPSPSPHTPDELSFLQQISSITTFGTAIILDIDLTRLDRLTGLICVIKNLILYSESNSHIALRAPPVLH